jgi:hypothetical protein
MNDATIRKQQERQRRKDAGLVRFEAWVPADALADARKSVQDVVDEYNRPPRPMPKWSAPVIGGLLGSLSARKAADAQKRAARTFNDGDILTEENGQTWRVVDPFPPVR